MSLLTSLCAINSLGYVLDLHTYTVRDRTLCITTGIRLVVSPIVATSGFIAYILAKSVRQPS